MADRLRAVVIGAGWAGEGHTRALRYCGVDVVAICARQTDVVRAVADRLEIAEASTDWRETLERLRPDVVSIATPASLRLEPIEHAAELGCHLFCDKPLGATAAEAEAAYRAVRQAGVKHAYGSTHRYGPSVAWLAELVAQRSIGPVREVVATFRSSFPPLLPWSWALTLAGGGGILNNGATHLFGIFERILGGQITRVAGSADARTTKAPVVPDVHDFRVWREKAKTLTPESAAQLEWRDVDADLGYQALLTIRTPDGDVPLALTYGSGSHPPGETNRVRLYGDAGLLVADGTLSFTAVSRLASGASEPEPLPVPERLTATLPQIGGDVMDKWAALAAEFVADVRGEPHEPYLTFRDGWRYQLAIDAIRTGRGLSDVPADLETAPTAA